MGGLWSRQNVRVEEVDFVANNAYRYPPKTGNYFASHFIMGGERFDANQPEAYLFGENTDLNFLGGKPTPVRVLATYLHCHGTSSIHSFVELLKSFCFYLLPKSSSRFSVAGVACGKARAFSSEAQWKSCGATSFTACSDWVPGNTGVAQSILRRSPTSQTSPVAPYSSRFHSHSRTCTARSPPYEYAFENYRLNLKLRLPGGAAIGWIFLELYFAASLRVPPCTRLFLRARVCALYSRYRRMERRFIQFILPTRVGIRLRRLGLTISWINSGNYLSALPSWPTVRRVGAAANLRFLFFFRGVVQQLLCTKTWCCKACFLFSSFSNFLFLLQSCQDVPPGYEVVPLVEALNGPVVGSPPLPPVHLTVGLPPEATSPDGTVAKPRRSGRRRAGSTSSLQTDGVAAMAPPEVVVAAVVSSDPEKGRVISPAGCEGRWSRRGSSRAAPEQVRLLAGVGEGSASVRRKGREAEAAETRSLLEGNAESRGTSHRTLPVSGAQGSVSASTPHSLHLCQARPERENKATDTSPGADDSDYYTPEDPATAVAPTSAGGHFLVDQGTDTSLDTPQSEAPPPGCEVVQAISPTALAAAPPISSARDSPDAMALRRRRVFEDRCSPVCEEDQRPIELVEVKATSPTTVTGSTFEARTQATSPARGAAVVGHVETSISLPGTPASNASNRSSGDSCSSGSSTRLLLSGGHRQGQSKTSGAPEC
ncbi:unnamed protein product [Ixodes hexagonus]